MTITLELLRALTPKTPAATLQLYIAPLNDTSLKYGITTPLRIAAFLAQCAHESAAFTKTTEMASGKAYDTGRIAVVLGNTPEEDGDGQKYKGRGLIQLTGKWNYDAVSKAFAIDFAKCPELLAQPTYAALSAGWFWNFKKLNALADAGKFDDITRKINPGMAGKAERDHYYSIAVKFLKIAA